MSPYPRLVRSVQMFGQEWTGLLPLVNKLLSQKFWPTLIWLIPSWYFQLHSNCSTSSALRPSTHRNCFVVDCVKTEFSVLLKAIGKNGLIELAFQRTIRSIVMQIEHRAKIRAIRVEWVTLIQFFTGASSVNFQWRIFTNPLPDFHKTSVENSFSLSKARKLLSAAFESSNWAMKLQFGNKIIGRNKWLIEEGIC